jgi:tight adherence protein C
MEPLLLVSAALGCVATVAMLFAVRAVLLAPQGEVLERVKRVTRPAVDEPALPARRSMWASLLAPFAGIARPKDENESSRAKKKLVQAGLRGPNATEVFFGTKVVFAALFGGGLLALSALRPTPIPNARLFAVFLVTLGFYAPNVWLLRRVRARQLAILRSLADTFDLLVTCVEAGLGLDAALVRIGDEIALSAPELAGELRLTTMEIHAGLARAEAFRRLADRTGVEELRAFSAMIIQTEMFGTSIANALRVHAAFMRTRRAHKAEERAAMASVKMVLPLIFCILPSLFSVILGPAVVRIARMILPALGGNP